MGFTAKGSSRHENAPAGRGPEAAVLLRISLPGLTKLTGRGLLTPVSGPKIDGCGRNRYLRKHVENLVTARQTAANPLSVSQYRAAL